MTLTHIQSTSREQTWFEADDGLPLSGTWHRPARPRVPTSAYVLLAPAMATPASFYEAFADWLADEGHTVLTFDYRSTTADASGLRRERADLLTWAGDAAAALEHVDTERRDRDVTAPIVWIGHSFGGQILPFVRHDLLSAAVLVATGHGYFRHNPPYLRRRAPLLWRGLVPLTTALAGYFPGRRLGILGDLPTGVVRQWGRWCLHPEYWGADVPDIRGRHALITHPVTLCLVRDDALVTRSGPRALAEQLTGATVTHVDVVPTQHGLTAIGHHGMFRPSLRHVWPAIFGTAPCGRRGQSVGPTGAPRRPNKLSQR